MADKTQVSELRLGRLGTPRNSEIALQETTDKLNELIRAWNSYTPPTGGGGGGAVDSFAGRTGAVIPVGTDYTPDFIGAIELAMRGTADGVASLDGTQRVPADQLGTGGGPAKYLRGDRTWQDFPVAGGSIPAAEKGAPNGVATLDAGSQVPFAQLGTGVATGTKFLRDDRIWAVPAGGGGGGVASFIGRAGAVVAVATDYTPAFIGAVPASHLTDADPHAQYQRESERAAANGYASLDAGTKVPTAQLGGAGADATKFLRGDQTWQVPGGGGSGTYPVYDHELSPAAPSALDDEFNAAALDAKWTGANWVGPWTYDIDTTVPGSVHVRATNAATINTLRCLLQAIPAGDFVIVTHLELSALPVSYVYAGLVMTSANTGNSGTHLFHGLVQEGNSYSRYTQTGSNFVGMSATLAADANSFEQEMLIRIRRVGANYFFGYSKNGRTWAERQLAPSFVPNYFGIGCLINGSAGFEASFQYFRYNAVATTKFGGRQLRTKA